MGGVLQDQEGVGGETASDPLASRRPLARLPPLGGGGRLPPSLSPRAWQRDRNGGRRRRRAEMTKTGKQDGGEGGAICTA